MKIATVMATALTLAAFTACDDGSAKTDTESTSDTEDTQDTEVSADDAKAAALLEEIDGYESWNQIEAWTGVTASGDGTHGDYVQIWYNDTAYNAIQAGGGGDMPDGAVIVKRGYDDADGNTEKNLTVMSKDAEYDGSTGWFWAVWSSEGNLSGAGEPSGCTGCHVSGQDYVLTTTW